MTRTVSATRGGQKETAILEPNSNRTFHSTVKACLEKGAGTDMLLSRAQSTKAPPLPLETSFLLPCGAAISHCRKSDS
eukprot:767071-Hanusia_phi.AAC.2